MELAHSKASGWAKVTADDLRECIQAFGIAMAELVGVDDVERLEFHRGHHRQERTVSRAPYLIGRREMMTVNISSGRLLMKSRHVGVACVLARPASACWQPRSPPLESPCQRRFLIEVGLQGILS